MHAGGMHGDATDGSRAAPSTGRAHDGERFAGAARRQDAPRAAIERITPLVLRLPTASRETDGTREWEATTLVGVRIAAEGMSGFGYTYGNPAIATVIEETIAPRLHRLDAFDIPAARDVTLRALRHTGLPGIGAMALSAVDCALWDLKARLLEVSLLDLFGAAREHVPLYASGGFTNYHDATLAHQLEGWVGQGFSAVKMKVGRDPCADRRRIEVAREAIGDDVALMIDANGALHRPEALALAERSAVHGVSWFEEPVSSDDLDGLRALRERVPAGMAIAAGEYGWGAAYYGRMLHAQAVDVLQADVGRCGGYSGLLQVAALCEAFDVPLSLHCVPALSAPIAAALPGLQHLEWFHDHVRVEGRLFDGLPAVVDGALVPDRDVRGHGLTLLADEAQRWRL